jgi:multidrug efflux pump subunit AcrB
VTSLALALTWTPTLSHYFIRSRGRQNPEQFDEAPSRGMRAYGSVLRFALEHRLALALFTVVLIGASYVCYSRLGSDLLPEMDEGGFVLDYIMPAGSSLEATNRVITHVEQLLRATPEVESTSRRTGMQLGLATVTEANSGDIAVKLKKQRGRGVDEVMADVRARVRHAEPVLDIEFTQILQDMIGDLSNAPEPCIIKLFSDDPDALRRWAPETAKAIGKIHGVVDILDGIENTISGPATVFNVDPVVAARAGFSPQEVEVDASAILQGEPAATQLVVNDRAYTIRVRFPARTRATLDAIRDTVLVSGTGKTASIGSLAGMVQIPGQTEIRRENLQRDVQVTARFEGLNLGEGMDKVQQAVRDLHIPSNIRVAYGGQYEEQQKSFRELVVVLLLAIVLVFTVLLFEFGSFAAPAAVLASAILSTSGVFLALLVTGTTFNLSSFMGLIMVIGIVAKNGILLLDADQKFRAAGVPAEESMLRAGERRLRPILMTALATVAGMIPLALAWGAGSQMLQPLAIAVIGGILASMVLSLVVTPAVRYYLDAGS